MTLIIGYGNPLRGDDGAGPAVAEEVSRRCSGVNVLTPHQLLPELADWIAHASLVVFIDAAVDGDPGVVTCEPVRRSQHPQFDHTMSPSSLLSLTCDAYGWEPPAWLVRIHGQAFEFAPTFSTPVAEALPGAVDLVHRLIPGR